MSRKVGVKSARCLPISSSRALISCYYSTYLNSVHRNVKLTHFSNYTCLSWWRVTKFRSDHLSHHVVRITLPTLLNMNAHWTTKVIPCKEISTVPEVSGLTFIFKCHKNPLLLGLVVNNSLECLTSWMEHCFRQQTYVGMFLYGKIRLR